MTHVDGTRTRIVASHSERPLVSVLEPAFERGRRRFADAVVGAAGPVGVLVGEEGRRGFPDFEKWCGVTSDESGRQRQAQAVETLLRGAKETLKTQ